jgi:hypothetical protein
MHTLIIALENEVHMPHDNADRESVTLTIMTENLPCPYCAGAGEVSGTVDDLAFTFACPCAGGSEAAVRWLLGSDSQAPPGENWVI